MSVYPYLGEVCLFVKDVEVVQSLYEELGLKKESFTSWFAGTPSSFHMYSDPIGPNTYLNICGPNSPDSGLLDLVANGDFFAHVCFVVEDWLKTQGTLLAAGIKLVDPHNQPWSPDGPFTPEGEYKNYEAYTVPAETEQPTIQFCEHQYDSQIYYHNPPLTSESEQDLRTYLSEVCVFVRDMEAAKSFYDKFELKEVKDEVVFKGTPLARRMVSYSVGPNVFLNVCASIGPESLLLNKALEKRGPGLDHICFAAEDAEKIVERFNVRGMRLDNVEGEPWEPDGNGKVNCFVGPVHGVRIQIVKPPYEIEYL